MKANEIPPHIVIDTSKEVIFYISKKTEEVNDLKIWMKKLNLPNHHAMVIKSKCVFNRLKDQYCNK